MKISLKYKILISIVNLISKTWRFQTAGNSLDRQGVVAFWHGYMLPVWKYFSKFHPVAVVSLSKDGEILSNILNLWNYDLARGSSSKGGKQILDTISEKAQNQLVLITPDGPTGPYHKFKPGAVLAAKNSETNLYLCIVSFQKKIIFKKSWDKFEFPLPFAKIYLDFSQKIEIESGIDRDGINEIIKKCEMILNEDKE